MRKALQRTGLTVLSLLLLFGLLVYAMEWRCRLQSHRIMQRLTLVQPGVTSKAEYFAAFGPYIEPLTGSPSDNAEGAGVFGVGLPPWIERIFFSMGQDVFPSGSRLMLANSPAFFVTPEFDQGVLKTVTIRNWQGNGHPYGISVIWHGGKYLRENLYGEPFAGYEFRSRTNIDSSGQRYPWESNVELDDRATPEQRSRALDLYFDCFTHLLVCDHALQYGNPAPDPQHYETP